MKNKLIVFTGPSGVGKYTIEKELFKDKSLNLHFAISATTRTMRQGEENGVHYSFISHEEFNKKIEANEFIEWNEHFSNKYGTLKSEISKMLDAGKVPFIEVEVNGAKNIIENYGSENVLSIFIMPPSKDELRNRITLRGTETEEEINERMSRVEEEMTFQGIFQHSVTNSNLDVTVEEVKKIIRGNN